MNRDVRKAAAPPLRLSHRPQALWHHSQGPEVGAAAKVKHPEVLPKGEGMGKKPKCIVIIGSHRPSTVGKKRPS